MIESHLPLVSAIAKRYAGRGETLDDLVQVGAVALVRASDRFDATRGVPFAAFATPAVEGEIRRHLGDRSTSVRIPRQLQRMTGQLRLRRAELSASLGRSPSIPELAKALGVEERDVERALEAERARDSISISENGAGDDVVAEPMAGSEDRVVLARGLATLEERERRIVFLRFHADMTEREISRAVGISQAHVSRLLAAALDKLRHQLDPDIKRKGAISPGSDENLAKGGDACDLEVTIATVGVSDKKAELDRYLALPYHVAVRSDGEGGRSSWTAAVEELPGCEVRGSTPDQAAARLRPVMQSWLATALAEGREIPVPGAEAPKRKPSPSPSGRFLIRMPSELHQELSLAAEREQVSLNRFITDALAASVGSEPPAPSSEGERTAAGATDPAAPLVPERIRAFRVALATNMIVVVFAGLVALALLILAVQRGI